MPLWLVGMLACTGENVAPSSSKIVLAYTTNVDGEIEPCG